MYSAYKLNKQGDNIQPWCTTFPIWNQSFVPCPILSVASWPAYRFLERQVRWSGLVFPSLEEFSRVCCDPHSQSLYHSQLRKTRYISGIPFLFLWSSGCWQFDLCFPLHFLNPAWRPGSSWFTYCWSLTWRTSRITLRPCEMSATCAGVWAFFGIAILWDWNENWPFPILWPLQSYLCWYSECSTLTASYFRIWNSSAEIPSPSIAMFVVVLPKVHLISHFRMSGQNVSDKPWSSGEGNANHFSILALRTPWTYGQARR